MSVAGLLLAAGRGRRLGGPKALVDFEGELLVERGARLLCGAGLAPVVVVLGAGASQVLGRAHLFPARAVVNERWREGVGSSLRAGLDELQAGPAPGAPAPGGDLGAEAVVVALADQPFVGPELVRRLVAAWEQGAPAAIASFAGKQRNPVLLDRSLWDGVKSLAVGDVGARAYLHCHPELVTAVACEDVGSPYDIDTVEDLCLFNPEDGFPGRQPRPSV